MKSTTFDLTDCVAKTAEIPHQSTVEKQWVRAVFSINDGEDIDQNYQVPVLENGLIDYKNLLTEIVHPFIEPDIRVIPSTINGICGDYTYTIETIKVNLKLAEVI